MGENVNTGMQVHIMDRSLAIGTIGRDKNKYTSRMYHTALKEPKKTSVQSFDSPNVLGDSSTSYSQPDVRNIRQKDLEDTLKRDIIINMGYNYKFAIMRITMVNGSSYLCLTDKSLADFIRTIRNGSGEVLSPNICLMRDSISSVVVDPSLSITRSQKCESTYNELSRAGLYYLVEDNGKLDL